MIMAQDQGQMHIIGYGEHDCKHIYVYNFVDKTHITLLDKVVKVNVCTYISQV